MASLKQSIITGGGSISLVLFIILLATGVIDIDLNTVFYCESRDMITVCDRLSSTGKTCYTPSWIEGTSKRCLDEPFWQQYPSFLNPVEGYSISSYNNIWECMQELDVPSIDRPLYSGETGDFDWCRGKENCEKIDRVDFDLYVFEVRTRDGVELSYMGWCDTCDVIGWYGTTDSRVISYCWDAMGEGAAE